MKKKLSAALASTMVLGTVPAFAAGANFTDIDNSFAKDAINQLVNQGVLNGDGQGHFNPSANVTRAEFAKILAMALKLDVSSAPATASFSDVPTTHWAFKYVEAVKKAGITNGIGDGQFGADATVTRQELAKFLVSAFNLKVDSSATTSFTDAIDSWAVPYVAAASKAGLIKGMGDGTFGAHQAATREQVAALVVRFENYQANAAKVTVSGNNSIAVGQQEKLSASAVDANGNAVTGTVTWAIVNGNGNAFIDANGNFIASAAGTYQVTATINGVTSAPANVVVYGAAAGVKLSASQTTVVANGVYTGTVTATIVDANGNPVTSYNGYATLKYDGSSNGATVLYNSATASYDKTLTSVTANVVNGVATFKFEAGSVAGVTDNLYISNVVDNSNNTLTTPSGAAATTSDLAISSVAQQATSVSLIAPKTIEANDTNGSGTVYAIVNDQTGNPMLTGTFPVAVTVSGVGTITGATNGTINVVYTGSFAPAGTQNNSAPVTVKTTQGQTGAINLTATSTGLTSGSATINAVLAGLPSTVAFSNQTLSFASSATSALGYATTTVQVVDSNGSAVGDSDNAVNVLVTNSAGSTASNVQVGYIDAAGVTHNGLTVNSNGSYDVPISASGSTQLIFWDNNSGANAGTYTVQVGSKAGAAYSLTSKTFTITETAGSFTKVAATSPSNDIAVLTSNPQGTFTIQLEDAAGNAVAQSGVKVAVWPVQDLPGNAPTGVTPTATLNGASSVTSAAPLTVTTNSNGQASVTLVSQAYDGVKWHVAGYVPQQGSISAIGSAAVPAFTSNHLTVSSSLSASLSVGVKDITPTSGDFNSTSYAVANDSVAITVYAKDQYGNVTNSNDLVEVTLPSSFSGGTSAPAGTTMYTGTWSQNGTNVVSIPLVNGTATFNVTAGTAGNAVLTAQDLTNALASKGTTSLTVQPGSVAGAALFYNGARLTSTNKLTVTANTPTLVYLEPVDAQNNPVVQTTAQTVELSDGGSGGTFSLSSGGAGVSTVTIAAGQTSVPVYYTNATAGTYQLGITTSVISNAILSGVPNTPVANSVYSVTVTSIDQYGNPMANQQVRVVLTSAHTNASIVGGTAGAGYITLTTDSYGHATFTYTAGTAGSSPDTFTVKTSDGSKTLGTATTGSY